MRSEWRLLQWLLALAVAVPAAAAQAPEEPLLAGSDGVPVPQRVRFVQPVYPPEAAARGLRGIVILSLTVDEQGQVAEVEVVRSVPPFDEAAIAAVEQWRYEPTEIDGRPVRVRVTVPISFLMKLPEVTRQDGIPELRSGAIPPFPPETRQVETVSAEISLAPDGQVASAEVLEGNPPWTQAVIAAVRTWRFDDNDLGPGVTMSFRVEARFLPEGGDGEQQVALQLTGLRRSETLPRAAEVSEPGDVSAGTPEPPAPPPEGAADEPGGEAPETVTAGAEPTPDAPTAEPTASEPLPETEAPDAGTGAADRATDESGGPAAAPGDAREPETAAEPAEEAPGEAAEPQTAGEEASTAPAETADVATEVLGGTPDAEAATEPPLPEEPGVSAVRGVFLEPGVPDLSEGRRPTVPPFARMQGVEGEVRVRFAVDAAGQSFVSGVEGPEELRPAARATVESWLFSRQSARRIYLLAELSYDATTATAVVKRER